MAKIELSKAEFAELIGEVMERLAREPSAKHLWQWKSRPGCADEPWGRSRRRHLGTLLQLMGATLAPTALAACGGDSESPCSDEPACGDDPCACSDDSCACADDPCASDGGAGDSGSADGGSADVVTCGDDPCACADDPCGCGDDPCACADDPCGCADDPCSVDAGPFDAMPDVQNCADDPCACADDPCGSG